MDADRELNYASVEFPGVGCVGKHAAMRGEQEDTSGPFASEVELLARKKAETVSK
jgi:hypothetical protein